MSAISKFRSSKITNQETGGGNKLSGLPPSIGGNAFIREAWKQRATVPYDKRNVVFCINQLGGIGRKSSMFGSRADGTDKKVCNTSNAINLFHWNVHWETFSDASHCGYNLITNQFIHNNNNADFISLIMGNNIDWTEIISKWTGINYHSIYLASVPPNLEVNPELDVSVNCNSPSSGQYAVNAKILYNADKWKVINTQGVWTDTSGDSCEDMPTADNNRPVIAGRFRNTDNQEIIVCSGNLPHIETQQNCSTSTRGSDWWINDLLIDSPIRYTSKDKYIFMMDTNYASNDPYDPSQNVLNSWVKASAISNQLNTLTPNIAINDKTGGINKYGFNENARTCCYDNLVDVTNYDCFLYPYDNIWANSTSMTNVKVCSPETIKLIGSTINPCISSTSEIHKWVAATVKF
jgi:hypothetical protein